MKHVLSIHSLACVLLLMVAVLSEPAQAQNMQAGLIMQVQPERGGASFPTESTRSGGGIPLKAWDYSVALPMSETGMQTGPRRYAAISIEKPIGNASPSILRAMLNGDPLTITIDVVGAGATSTVLLHRVVFGQARIISITRNGTGSLDERTSGTVSDRGGPAQMTETVKFEFRRVEFDPGRPNGSIVDELEMIEGARR